MFQSFGVDVSLDHFDFLLLVLATVSIAAAGNIINDIYDVEIDRINKPHKMIIGKSFTERAALRWFIILNVIGVGIGFYLSNLIGRPGFAALFIVISAMLYLYASYLKGILVIGNFIVSGLVAMSLLIIAIFDLLPSITPQNQVVQSSVFKIVMDYAFFAFAINFIREIVKDLQDINGDKKGGIKTLAIILGRKRTIGLVSILSMFFTFGIIFYMYEFLYDHELLMLYFLFGIVAPLLYFCIKAWSADSNKEYAFLSKLLKIVMFVGICSLLLFQFDF